MTAANPHLAQALATGAKRYFGVVCKKHPELNGERNCRNRGCIACNRDKMRSRRAENPEFWRAHARANYLKHKEKILARGIVRARLRRTGIDDATYKRLLEVQGWKCPVCRADLNQAKPHADHCHDTKRPRGILCAQCNQAEGMIRRSGLNAQEFGQRLQEYLTNPPVRKLEQ